MDQSVTHYQRYITEKEIKLILDRVIKSPKWFCFFNIMAYMGLRVNEVCRIRIEDIKGDFEILRVVLTKQKSKIIDRPIPERIKPILRLYTAMIKAKRYKYLFPPENNRSKHEYLQTATVRWKLFNLRKELGISDIYYVSKSGAKLNRICSHAFRHFFITQFYRKSGFDISLTKSVIHHIHLDTTLVYIQNDIEREKEVLNKI